MLHNRCIQGVSWGYGCMGLGRWVGRLAVKGGLREGGGGVKGRGGGERI